jgi:hypothetical protein
VGLVFDADSAAQEVDISDPQPQELPDAQPEASLGEHHRPIPGRHRIGQGVHLGH